MILADTSGILPIFLPREPARPRVLEFLASHREPLRMPTPCVGEIGHFFGRMGDSTGEARFLRAVAHGDLVAEDPVAADYLRAAELVEQYAGFPLGAVDALVVAIAERLNVTSVMTLDRRHFGAIRPRHCPAFTLVP